MAEARAVVEAVLDELRGRKGFDDWWDSLDEDIAVEVEESLVEVVEGSI